MPGTKQKADSRTRRFVVEVLICLVIAIGIVLGVVVLAERRLTPKVTQLDKPTVIQAFEELHASTGTGQVAGAAGDAGAETASYTGDDILPDDAVSNVLAYQQLFMKLEERLEGGTWLSDLEWSDYETMLPRVLANQDFLCEIRHTVRRGEPVQGVSFLGRVHQESLWGHICVTQCCHLLRTDALYWAHQGNYERSVDDLVAGFQLAHAQAAEPSLLIEYSALSITLRATEECLDLAGHEMAAELRERLQATLPDPDNREYFARSWLGKLWDLHKAFDRSRHGKSGYIGSNVWHEALLIDLYDKHGFCMLALRDELMMAEKLRVLAELAHEPYYSVRDELEAMCVEVDSTLGNFASKSLLCSVFPSVFMRRADLEARVSLMRIALYLEDYFVVHGAYPATLDELVKDRDIVLPCDPFSGEPYHYRLDGDRFVIYSVGRNLTDDRASVAEWIVDDQLRREELDIVWPSLGFRDVPNGTQS